MSDDINFKKIIIKDMVNNIEKNEDAKILLIDLISLEKNNDKKIELLKNFNKEIKEIILSHIQDNNYDSR